MNERPTSPSAFDDNIRRLTEAALKARGLIAEAQTNGVAATPSKPLHEMSTDELRQYAALSRMCAVTEMAPAGGHTITEVEAAALADPATPLHQMGYDARHAHSAAAWAATTQGHGSPFWRRLGPAAAPPSNATA